MSPKEWFGQGSPRVVGSLLAAAVLTGLGAGAWLQLPGYLAEPIYSGSPQMILADDPGRARWDQMVASLGGLGATFVVPAAFYTDRSPPPEFAPTLEAQMAAATAQIDEQVRESERRAEAIRMAWVEAAPRRYGYEPVRYSEPPTDAQPIYSRGYEPAYEPAYELGPTSQEQTTAALDEPQPPPPPRPADGG